jgi:hypothetical protein
MSPNLPALAEIHSQLEEHPHALTVWMFYVQRTKPKFTGDVPMQREYLFLFERDACKFAVNWITHNRGALLEPNVHFIDQWFSKSKLWRGGVMRLAIAFTPFEELPTWTT